MTDPKPAREHDEQQNKKWYERTRYQILLFAGWITLLGFALWVILDLYIDPQTSAQKKDLVQALGLILAGVAGAIGIFFTWRGQRITREGLEHTQKNTEEQLRLTREG
jgi:predicted MPP superfamily phosphohydrolase